MDRWIETVPGNAVALAEKRLSKPRMTPADAYAARTYLRIARQYAQKRAAVRLMEVRSA